MSTDGLPYPFEFLIVDNNPSALTRDLVGKLASEAAFPIQCIPEPRRGACYARNTGVKMSRGDYVAFLDDDCTVHQDWLLNLMNAVREHECDIIQGKITLEFDDQRIPGWIDDSDILNFGYYDPGNQVMSATTIMTGNACVKKSVFEKYGFFDVRLGPGAAGAAEDLEFFRRMKNRGLTILYIPDVEVRHHISSERVTKSALFERSRAIGYSLTFSGIDPHHTLAHIPRLMSKIMLRFIKALLFRITRNEAREFKQRKKIACYKGKIMGIKNHARYKEDSAINEA
jgi:GT2 family glycosyltransferase